MKMLKKINNREVVSDRGYSIQIEGMFRLIYKFGDRCYELHIEPLQEDQRGHNMMIDPKSIKEPGSKTYLLLEDEERTKIFSNLVEGLAVLGVKPWIPGF
jgi:hypothetical protein